MFLHCRAAIDALSGAKQEVFASLSDKQETDALNNLMLQAGRYFISAGTSRPRATGKARFLSIIETRFALNLVKLLIAHTSQVLSS